MSPAFPAETLFGIANPLALIGWVALTLSPVAPRAAGVLAGRIIPLLLSLLYTALVLSFWADGEGGFGSLAQVMRLFDAPTLALAGWVHFLAFDLVVGAWIAQTAAREGIAHWLTLPCLLLTFLFGPAGFLTFAALRAAHVKGVTA